MLLIIAAIVCGIGWSSHWYSESDLSQWRPWGKGTEAAAPEGDPSGGDETDSGLITPNEYESNGIKFKATSIPVELYDDYGVSAAAETAFTLTVTPTPSGTALTDVTFTARFANDSSAWAQGKEVTDYITISQQDNTSATISCLDSFGEQIIVVYTFTGEQDGLLKPLTAEYPLDYASRIIACTLSFQSICNTATTTRAALYVDSGSTYNAISLKNAYNATTGQFRVNPGIMSDYTVLDTFNFNMSFELTEEFKSTCKTRGGVNLGSASFPVAFSSEYMGTIDFSGIKEVFAGYLTDTVMSTALSNVFGYLTHNTPVPAFKASIEAVGKYSTYNGTIPFGIAYGGFSTAASDVQFPDDGKVI